MLYKLEKKTLISYFIIYFILYTQTLKIIFYDIIKYDKKILSD